MRLRTQKSPAYVPSISFACHVSVSPKVGELLEVSRCGRSSKSCVRLQLVLPAVYIYAVACIDCCQLHNDDEITSIPYWRCSTIVPTQLLL